MQHPVTIVRVIGRRLHMVLDAEHNVLAMENRSAMPSARPVRLAITAHGQRLDGDTFHVGAPVLGALMMRLADGRSGKGQHDALASYFDGDPLFHEMSRATLRTLAELPAAGDGGYFKHRATEQLADWIDSIDRRSAVH